MSKIRVCIAGITGWVGKALAQEILKDNSFELVGGIARNSFTLPLKKILENSEVSDIPIYSDIDELYREIECDVIIDYTKSDCVKRHVHQSIKKNINVVIGTSGLTDEDYSEIESLANEHNVGVIAAGNFSITATLLSVFARKAAKYINQWEILEYSPSTKIDAPNGTTRELAFQLSKIAQAQNSIDPRKVIGNPESRGATINNTQIHSVRLPSFYSSNEIIFASEDERLTLRQDGGGSATPYVNGTIHAVKKVVSTKGLIRGLDKVLDID